MKENHIIPETESVEYQTSAPGRKHDAAARSGPCEWWDPCDSFATLELKQPETQVGQTKDHMDTLSDGAELGGKKITTGLGFIGIFWYFGPFECEGATVDE